MSDVPAIHYSNWSQQPDVWLACGRWTTPAWSQGDGLDAGIYEEDDGDLYTFEHFDRVNCEACLAAVREGTAEPR